MVLLCIYSIKNKKKNGKAYFITKDSIKYYSYKNGKEHGKVLHTYKKQNRLNLKFISYNMLNGKRISKYKRVFQNDKIDFIE